MAESAPLKKSSIIKDWMVQADPPKEANGEKKWMTGRYSSLQIQRYFTLNLDESKWCFEKKNVIFTKV